MGPQCLDIPGAVFGATQRVHQQGYLFQAQPLVEAPRQGDDLGIEVRVGRAQDLHPHLVELSETALLRPLISEVGPGVPGLVRQRGSMLGESADHRCGLFGPQRQSPSTLVLEGVHLLADDVGGLAETLEHLDVFEHRRDDLEVPRGADHLGEDVD